MLSVQFQIAKGFPEQVYFEVAFEGGTAPALREAVPAGLRAARLLSGVWGWQSSTIQECLFASTKTLFVDFQRKPLQRCL